MNLEELNRIVSLGESVERELKSDRGQGINDKTIYEEVVALANTDGGVLLIGVEDDGQVTGAKPRHGDTTEPRKLQSAIFNNTVPNINTRISVVGHDDGNVLCIEVDSYPEPCATASGKSLRRSIGADGKPQSVPFYPRDQKSRRIDLGLLDYSTQTIDGTSFADLDPLEFERVKQAIGRLSGDRRLLNLSNEELAKAMKLVESQGEVLVPNVAGLLLLGRREAIESVLPTHEICFQVLTVDGEVRVNDRLRIPVLAALERIEERFSSINTEQEVQFGLFRLPVPDYSPIGFREAVNNALLHRDFTQLGSVYVQWHADHLLITNPGGFPEGINAANILSHEPKPQNPRLAEAASRIGLVEQTGRGVDKIFMGQLRFGRPAPDYGRSDKNGVRVVLMGGDPWLAFTAFVYEQDQGGMPLSLDHLMVLSTLYHERRIDAEQCSLLIQKGAAHARALLEELHERGFVEARGERRGRAYHLAGELYRRFGSTAGYVRTKGFDEIQRRQMVLNAVEAEGKITRGQVMELCLLTRSEAYQLLKKMVEDGSLEKHGETRGVYYTKK
jgi:ATP-dependent DNA helicase RecG